MFGKIYLKLYLWFLLVFFATLVIVWLLSARFHDRDLRDEMHAYLVSSATLLKNQYVRSCVEPPAGLKGQECKRFFQTSDRMLHHHLWILDRDRSLIATNESFAPRVPPPDFHRALSGDVATSFRPRSGAMILVPVNDAAGKVQQILVVQRTLFPRRRPRGILVPLIVIGSVIALLVLPLSRRLTRRLRELHRYGREWSEGHLEKRVAVHGKDEIAELAVVFNTMAGNLQRILDQRKEFLALISHELKSPLTRIRLAAELLKEEDESIRKAELHDSIEKEIEVSETLIDQLLVLSRVEMNPGDPLENEVDLSILLQSVANQARPFAETAGVHLEVETGDKPTIVRGDLTMLQRAFSNVIENAIKFSPSGGAVRLQIREGNEARVLIADQGKGIEADECEKIFEPFYRGKSAVIDKGSGLGLFIARRIFETHGGAISAGRGEGGQGTVIDIRLPLLMPRMQSSALA